MKTIITLFTLALTFSVSAKCPQPWVCENIQIPVPYTSITGEFKVAAPFIRAGYLPHAGEFKGNILYFQGLGDSMLNHAPLFSKISKAGYRVVAFDYMGQGGSTGKMDNTRIKYIPWIGEFVWKRFAYKLKENSTRTIIGWSTGGLAAYQEATKNNVDKVILIAPGIAPRKIVGEGLMSWPPNEITLGTLTSDFYRGSDSDPHRDIIRPNSPLKVPLFAINLLKTAESMKNKTVPKRVKGFVLLSGENDTYVNALKTRSILNRNAKHFKVKAYDDALHEIDNERKEIRERAHKDILDFLDS